MFSFMDIFNRGRKVGTATRYEVVEQLLWFCFPVHPETGGQPAFCKILTASLSQANVRPAVSLSLLTSITFSFIPALPQYCLQSHIAL